MIKIGDFQYYYFNPIYDRCVVKINNTNEQHKHSVLMMSRKGNPLTDIDRIEERRVLHNNYAEFDISEYLRTFDADLTFYTSCLDNYAFQLLQGTNAYMIHKFHMNGDGNGSLNILPLVASMRYGEKMCAESYHFWNKNFPQCVSGIVVGTLICRDNGVMTGGAFRKQNIGADEICTWFYEELTQDYHRNDFTLEFSNHIEPSKERNVVDFTENPTEEQIKEKFTDTRVDHNIIDCRTKGECVRFLDRFGFARTLVLDLYGKEATTTATTDMVYPKYNDRISGNAGGILNGNNFDSYNTQTEVLHCGLENYPDFLYNDLCDLALSPVVLRWMGGSVWEKVTVTMGKISKNERMHKISVDIDILPTKRNSIR